MNAFTGPRKEMITPWSTNAVEIIKIWASKVSIVLKNTLYREKLARFNVTGQI